MKYNKSVQNFKEYNKIFEDEAGYGDIYSHESYEQVIKNLEEARDTINDALDILNYEKFSKVAPGARSTISKANNLKNSIDINILGKRIYK